jgi:DUF971 family protein
MQESPTKVELVGSTLAIAWPDGKEDYLDAPYLRKNSPSAEQKGESDIFGNISGGSPNGDYPNVEIKGFEYVGNYAIRIQFTDGHSTGIYSWEYLGEIAGNQS